MGHGFVQKLVVGRPGFEARRTGRRAGGTGRPQLAGIEAPSVLHLLIPLPRQQHKPLLARRLAVIGVGIPGPQQRARR